MLSFMQDNNRDDLVDTSGPEGTDAEAAEEGNQLALYQQHLDSQRQDELSAMKIDQLKQAHQQKLEQAQQMHQQKMMQQEEINRQKSAQEQQKTVKFERDASGITGATIN